MCDLYPTVVDDCKPEKFCGDLIDHSLLLLTAIFCLEKIHRSSYDRCYLGTIAFGSLAFDGLIGIITNSFPSPYLFYMHQKISKLVFILSLPCLTTNLHHISNTEFKYAIAHLGVPIMCYLLYLTTSRTHNWADIPDEAIASCNFLIGISLAVASSLHGSLYGSLAAFIYVVNFPGNVYGRALSLTMYCFFAYRTLRAAYKV